MGLGVFNFKGSCQGESIVHVGVPWYFFYVVVKRAASLVSRVFSRLSLNTWGRDHTRVPLVEGLDQLSGMLHLGSREPRVFRVRVPFPFNEVLYSSFVRS